MYQNIISNSVYDVLEAIEMLPISMLMLRIVAYCYPRVTDIV